MNEIDWIRRSEVIESLDNTDWYHQNRNKDMVRGANSNEHQAWYKAEDVYKALESVPSAQPERKTGEWVGAVEYCKYLEETTGERYQPSGLAGMIYCNQCWTGSDRKSNYCRSCGADMRGEENG